MAGVITPLFSHSVSIRRATRTSDGQGGWIESFAEVDSVTGRVCGVSAADVETASQRRAHVTHAVYLDPGADVRIGDRLTVGSLDLDVKVADVTPSIPVYRKVLALEIQKGSV